MNGLVISGPWVEMILDGKKSWEIRGRNTQVRGRIALIRGGSGLIVGTCDLTNVVGPLTRDEFRRSARKAGLKELEASSLPYRQTYCLGNGERSEVRSSAPIQTPIWSRDLGKDPGILNTLILLLRLRRLT